MAAADYIIIGGGVGGCVVASRLHQKCPSASILLIEAGLDASKNPMSVDSIPTPVFQHSDLEWNYKTVSQKHLSNKICSAGAGKAVGGGSAINACTSSPTRFHVTTVDATRWLVPRRQE
jgi:choline dehydrogenase-like flavoprotein